MSLTPEILIKRDLDFTNVSKYHEIGYKGKGFVIFNTEDGSIDISHMKMTNTILNRVAPEATVINGRIGTATIQGKTDVYAIIDGKKLDLKETIKKYNIKVMTTSKEGGNANDNVLNYLKECQKELGVIHLCAGGNNGELGVYVRNNTTIAVAGGYVYPDLTVKKIATSTSHDELDFVAPLGGGQGSSAASPFLAGMTVLLLERYGNFTHDECVEILKSISKPLSGKIPQDYGMPILPLTYALEILNELRKNKNETPEPVEEGGSMDFKDVEKGRWSKQAIDRCVEEGLLIGFEDGTFRPTEHVTREQFAQILTRILDKIKGR